MSILERIVHNDRIETIPPIKWMIEGAAKTGKSTDAASWPSPLFLDMPDERGLQFLEGVDRLPVEKSDDIRDVYEALKKGKHKFKTVVFDTINALFAMFAREHTNGGQMRIQDYPKVYDKVLSLLDAFSSLGVHVVVISHIKALFRKTAKGDDPIVDKYVNALPGQLSERVAARMDHILHTKVEEEGDFRVLCRNRALYEAGGRIKELPQVVDMEEGAKLFPILVAAFEAAKGNGKKKPAKRASKSTPPPSEWDGDEPPDFDGEGEG